MLVDNIFEDEVRLSSSSIDAFYVARLNYYFSLVQDIPAFHTLARHVSVPELKNEDKSWMILRSHIRISRYANWAERLRVSTWALPTTGLRCPRWVVAMDGNNNELFRANTLWCVVNTKSHHPERPDSVNERLGLAADSPITDEFPPKPDFPGTKDVKSIPVHPDFFAFDYNGHLNNISYIDLILYSFDRSFLNNNLAGEVDIIWKREIRPDDSIFVKTVFTSPNESISAIIRRESDGTETECCSTRLLWQPRAQLSNPL